MWYNFIFEEVTIRLIDLSHTIRPGMPVYPGDPGPSFEVLSTVEEGGFYQREIRISSHVGTHIDAPAHVKADGRSLDRFPAEAFFGKAAVLDVTGREKALIEVADLESRQESLEQSDFLLLHSSWSRYWGTDRYFRDYPVLSPAAAAWLRQFPLRGIGIDMVSVDAVDSEGLAIHHMLLENDLLIIENLTNLEQLPPTDSLFACWPLKLRDADASPVRAVAIIGPAAGIPIST